MKKSWVIIVLCTIVCLALTGYLLLREVGESTIVQEETSTVEGAETTGNSTGKTEPGENAGTEGKTGATGSILEGVEDTHLSENMFDDKHDIEGEQTSPVINQESEQDINVTVKAEVDADMNVLQDAGDGRDGVIAENFDAQSGGSDVFTNRNKIITKNDATVIFQNGSACSMSWAVMDSGTAIYSTGILKPGEFAVWDVWEVLVAGSYAYTVDIVFYEGERVLAGKGGSARLSLDVVRE